MRAQSGQATLEWVGLVLMAALALGALGLAWSESRGREATSGRELGDAVAARIACAARGSCAADPPPVASAAPRVAADPGPAPRRAGAPGMPSAAQASRAFQSLRGVAWIARQSWIVCLGYRRWRYELEHPRVPTEPLPPREGLQILNKCLNPYAFLGS